VIDLITADTADEEALDANKYAVAVFTYAIRLETVLSK